MQTILDFFIKKYTRGQSTVEFALLLPVFLLFLFGLIEIGFVIAAQQITTYAAREGARAGALTNDNNQILSAIDSAVAFIDQTGERTIVEIIPNSGRTRGDQLLVRIEYTVPLNIPLLDIDDITLQSQSTARVE